MTAIGIRTGVHNMWPVNRRPAAAVMIALVCSSGVAQVYSAASATNTYDSPPRMVHEVAAKYTAVAQRHNIRGTVTVAFTIDTDGVPRRLRVTHGLGSGLDAAAVSAVAQDRFAPALRNGIPTEANCELAIPFEPKSVGQA